MRIINGRATPANQVLPPLMPGYDTAYKGYPYDVEGAKKLMAEAGLKDGFSTTLYAMNTDPNPRIAQAIQQDLAAIGIKAEIKALAQPEVIAAGGNKDESPLIWSGGMGWIADFPDPSDFYGPILGCGGAVAGGWNWSWYCDKSFEDRATKANAMSKPEQKDAALQGLGADLHRHPGAAGPWAPVFNERRVVAKSKRMGGPDQIYIDPTRGDRLRGDLHQAVNRQLARPHERAASWADGRIDPRASVRMRRGLNAGNRTARTRTMCVVCNHTIHRKHHNFAWSRDFAPVLICKPGETIHFECLDPGAGHFTPQIDRRRRRDGRLRQGQSGDRPGVHRRRRAGRRGARSPARKFIPSGWGWTRTSPASACSPTSSRTRRCTSGHMTPRPWRRPLRPQGAGAAQAVRRQDRPGARRARPAQHRSAAPGRRQHGHPRPRRGRDLYLPVEVAGGLFSIGDTHAAQGDGEVCGTAIESQMDVALTFDLVKGANLKFPRFTTRGSGHAAISTAQGYEVDARASAPT